jgi:uncharacterized delta-60 repeat protein
MRAGRLRAAFAIGVALCFFAAVPLAAQAAAGDLDPTFGTAGTVTTAVGPGGDTAYDVAFQSDGKILAAGSCASDFCLGRYNGDGSLDTSFDTDGVVTTAVGAGSFGWSQAVAVQSDGKIVAALGCPNTFCLARFNSDGSLDTSFDTDGLVSTDVDARTGWRDITTEVLIQSDQRIVATGYCRVNDDTKEFCLARYNSDGSLDTSFDSDGKVANNLGFNDADIGAGALQSDGKIVVVGKCGPFELGDSCVARFNSNGSLDTSFDNDGFVTTVIDTGSFFSSVTVQSDGKIVASGAFLARFNGNGSLDTSFDADGTVTNSVTYPPASFSRGGLAVQSDGAIVATVFCPSGVFGEADFCLARFNGNGSLDTSFDADGFVTTSIGVADLLSAVGVQGDGKIVAAGGCNSAAFGPSDFCLARYDGGAIGDGIDDALQPPGTPPGSFYDDTGSGTPTTGTLVTGSVTVTDAPDPSGVVIIAGATGAILTMCPPPLTFSVTLPPGTSTTEKCGSLTVEAVANGSAIVRIPGTDVSVTFAAGSSGTVESDGGISVTGASGDVTMTVSGASAPVPAGDSTLIERGTRNDLINGTSGNDLIFDAGGNNTINGKGGNDTIVARSGNDTIDGGDGGDWIDAGDGNNTLKGGAGSDLLKAGKGNDTIDGGVGFDTCDPGLGKNTVKNCEA